MARPQTKEQLLTAAEENFNQLFVVINSIPEPELEKAFSFDDRDKNIRDVVIHLYEWQKLLLNWINANQTGNKINFLPEPYNWKTYPQMNVDFWKKHQQTPYKKSIELLKSSHSAVITLINSFSDEELFTKKYFPWTGTTHLGSYCISATSSHYDWAIKKIKKHIKTFTAK